MAHVVSLPTAPFRARSGAFEVHQIPAAEDNLIWLFVCLRTNAAAIVDGPDAENVLAYAHAQGITVTHVLNTHTHGDHIGLNRDLLRRGLLPGLEVIGPRKVARDVPGLTQAADDGDIIEVGACKARVMRTEGHIDGHICFVFDDVLFSGDTLFAGGCGRVFTGDYPAMYEGLSRLSQLPGETRICCAHEYTKDNLRFALSVEPGNTALELRYAEVRGIRAEGRSAVPSTMALELATNPMLRWSSPELIARVHAQAPAADLSSPLGVFTATRKLKDSGAYKRES
ncbi:MAG: hydroxyacylglutathione hydrolase [Myxococcaceae bacterium]|nr:hydroxyacylglutathione hydrolase [Myxococcaceae bacterium]